MKKSATDLTITLTNPAPVPMIRNRGATSNCVTMEQMNHHPNGGQYYDQSNVQYQHQGNQNANFYRGNGYETSSYETKQNYARNQSRRPNGGPIQSDL